MLAGYVSSDDENDLPDALLQLDADKKRLTSELLEGSRSEKGAQQSKRRKLQLPSFDAPVVSSQSTVQMATKMGTTDEIATTENENEEPRRNIKKPDVQVLIPPQVALRRKNVSTEDHEGWTSAKMLVTRND